MQRILVVMLSYTLVWGVESTPYSGDLYYFLLASTCFVLALICSRTKDDILIVYAVMQLIMMFLYICLISLTESVAKGVLYSPTLNYSIIVFAYELYILSTGLFNVLRLLCNLRYNVHNSSSGNNKGNFEAKHSA